MNTSRILNRLMNTSEILPLDSSSRICIMSDCHRGVGNWGDNFMKNQHLFFAALTHYYKEQFTYIELGDGDELWENKDLCQIIQTHSDCFWLMSKFYAENRLYLLLGNHDDPKKSTAFLKRTCDSYYCESLSENLSLFPNLVVHNGLILKDAAHNLEILLIHGHQGEILNDLLSTLARLLVRFIWRPLELLGISDPTSTAKNYDRREHTKLRLCSWAEKNRQLLIAGHTHRPMLPMPGDIPYFNSGSCVHPRCITCLEIQNLTITLVKWCTKTREDLSLYVGREILAGPYSLRDYLPATQE